MPAILELPPLQVAIPPTAPRLQAQPFWGWPYSSVPAQDSSAGQEVDSLGNVDPNWELPVRSPWDTATLNGFGVPGLVRIRCPKAHRKDKKQQPGVHNGTLTLLGFDLAEIHMKVVMWTEAQWDAYQKLTDGLYRLLYQAILDKDTTGASAAVDIQYPSLACIGVQKVVVHGFQVPEPGSTPGTMEAVYQMTEYNPAKAGSPQTVVGAAPSQQSVQNAFNRPPRAVPPHKNPSSVAP